MIISDGNKPVNTLDALRAQVRSAQVTLEDAGETPAPREDAPDFTGSLTDLGNSQRFAAQHAGALRYTAAHGWLAWDGKRWKADETGEVFRLARRTVSAMMHQAAQQNAAATRAMEALAKRMESGELDQESAEQAVKTVKAAQQRAQALGAWAVKSQGRDRLKAMCELAQSEPGIAAHAGDFDRDPWLLNCQNGILNLKTGKLSPHDPGAMMTQIAGANYDPSAKCPTWLTFLERVQPSQEMHPFLQRSTGYALTGNTSEQRYWNKIGTGANGKSVYTTIVMALLGSYAIRLRAATFMQQKSQSGASATPDIARIEGKRLVLTDEIPDSQVLDDGLVKSITGEDRIAARKLYRDGHEFTSQAKLWFVGNHKPVIKDVGYSIWRRVLLVDFPVTIPDGERDPALTGKLLAEIDGILTWAVQGCLDWQRSGLAIPQAVIDATNEYRSDSDLVGQWLGDCTKETELGNTPAKALFESYQKWCKANGLRDMSATALGRKLTERGIDKVRMNSGNVYLGLELLPESEGE